MAYEPFLIAPFNTGLETDLEPWLTPADAFKNIINGHIHHGVTEKRSGYRELGKLVHGDSVNWGITGITLGATTAVTVTSTTGLNDGDTVTFANVTGTTEINNVEGVISNVVAGGFDVAIDSSGFTAYAGGGDVYLIPGLRVMGLHQHIDPQNAKELIAFDTERACRYDSTNDRFEPLDDSDIFDSADTDYIWADNWASTSSSTATTLYRLYFTNNKIFDGTLNGIRYYTGPGGTTTTSFAPLINGAIRINGCKLLFAFRQRLLLLHTYEGANTYPQRLRWCQIQNPDAAGAWDDNVAGKGGFVDAPTGDQIISARALQNGIVVQFTNSVWTITPTSDPALPFRWDKINDFRSCDGKMASVEYDRYVVALGLRGITATDGVETRRIDQRIEDFVTEEINADEFDKVFASRSYGERRTWILYPKAESEDADATLVFDDESQAFSKYDISMNVLGYGADTSNDLTAPDLIVENGYIQPGTDPAEDIEASGFTTETALSFFFSGKSEIFIGGDRSGIVYFLEAGGSDDGSDITLEIQSTSWAPYKEEGVKSQFGFIDLFVDADISTRINIDFFKDNDETPYKSQEIDCLPNLNYKASINNIIPLNPSTSGVTVFSDNHGLITGNTYYIYGVTGMDELNDAAVTITVVDGDSFTIAIDASSFGNYIAGGKIYERKFYRTKVWKRAFVGGIGYQHRIFLEEESSNPVRIHAFKPYFRKRGKRTI